MTSPVACVSPTMQKPPKEVEERHVVREGPNSLVTHANASAFSVFSHIRHFVLQTQLCETFNSRSGLEGETREGMEEEQQEEEEGEGKKEAKTKMPVVSVVLEGVGEDGVAVDTG